jgi:hypothetical protein
MRRVVTREVGVVADTPAVFVDAHYVARGAHGDAYGTLKLMVFASETAPMLCIHDQLGYHATFKRVTIGLAASLKVAAPQVRTARFTATFVRMVDGQATGFSRRTVYDVEGGGKVSEERTTTFTPRSPTDLVGADAIRVEEWDGKGHIQSISFAKGEGGDLLAQIQVKRSGVREYHVEGTRLGATLDSTFRTKAAEGLVGDAELYARTKKLLGTDAPGQDLRFEAYAPDVDPAAPIEVDIRPLSRPDRTVAMTFGALRGTAVIDAEGRPERLEMPQESAVLRLERASVRGDP